MSIAKKSTPLDQLTKAYIAIDGLLKSPLMSDVTRRQLQMVLADLDKEIVEMMREQLKQQPDDVVAS